MTGICYCTSWVSVSQRLPNVPLYLPCICMNGSVLLYCATNGGVVLSGPITEVVHNPPGCPQSELVSHTYLYLLLPHTSSQHYSLLTYNYVYAL
jgi:hypothetical protein